MSSGAQQGVFCAPYDLNDILDSQGEYRVIVKVNNLTLPTIRLFRFA